jgi:multicomponent K+:H+ antiporter subunit C
MAALAAVTVAVLVACGVYLVLRGRTFPVAIGLSLLSYAVNLFLFATGRLVSGAPPIAGTGLPPRTRCPRPWYSPPSSSASA